MRPLRQHPSAAPMARARCLLTLAMLGLLAGQLPAAHAAAPTPAAAPLSEQERALHVLNRLAYGPRPGDLEEVERMGVKRYIDQQLHPERIPLPAQLQASLAALPGLQMTPAQLFVDYGPPS